MSAVIIRLQDTRAAKAKGVFAAVNIAARRMGYNPTLALRAAQKAERLFREGPASPAKAVADANATLRAHAPAVEA